MDGNNPVYRVRSFTELIEGHPLSFIPGSALCIWHKADKSGWSKSRIAQAYFGCAGRDVSAAALYACCSYGLVLLIDTFRNTCL